MRVKHEFEGLVTSLKSCKSISEIRCIHAREESNYAETNRFVGGKFTYSKALSLIGVKENKKP